MTCFDDDMVIINNVSDNPLKQFLEQIGYTLNDIAEEEGLRRIFLKNGKTIRLWNILQNEFALTIYYSIFDEITVAASSVLTE